MYKYAQIYNGKIIYFYESKMTIDELQTIFAPETWWIDVTNIECDLNWVVYYIGDKLYIEPPREEIPIEPPTFEELKAQKLAEINYWTKQKIIGGFKSNCYNEQVVTYDSDVETQITVQGICLNVKSELFKQRFPDGCPMRGYPEGASMKSIFMFNPDQLFRWQADLSTHIGTCKKEGWAMQQKLDEAQTEEDLDAIVLEMPQIRTIGA